MVKIKRVDEINLKGMRVLLRVDFNVPLGDKNQITDDTRIVSALQTINYIIQHGGKLIIASHLGRPKGKKDSKYSLAPVAERLSQLLNKKVELVPDCIGGEVQKKIEELKEGDLVLLENLRFYEEEEKNDKEFSKALASLCDVYINDAFGAAHRAHASVEGITHYVKEVGAGFLMIKEIECLEKVLVNPEKPYIAILGGAKISDKIGVIENLLDKVDTILIGGGMAYTFLKAQGFEVGRSIIEEDKIKFALDLIERAKSKTKLILPLDHVAAQQIREDAKREIVSNEEIPPDWVCLDIGPETIKRFSQEINPAKTIFWNGPMGVFEMKPFSQGSFSIAKEVANSKAFSVVGGGDTIAVINKAGVSHSISHISTGGGASLEFIEGKKLPGIEALRKVG
jgi:phosphoglycerate kinase